MRSRGVPPLDLTSVYSTAYHLTSLGYHCLPIVGGKKACAIKEWTNLRIPLSEVHAYFAPETDHGVGLLLGTEVSPGVFPIALDIDVDDDLLIERTRAAIGGTPPAKRGSKGVTFFVRGTGPSKARRLRRKDATTGSHINCLEILATGEQTVIPPSVHPFGMNYVWVGPPLTSFPPTELPELTSFAREEIELAVRRPESPLFFINTMLWNGEGGGGDIHNSVVSATAAMVSMGWPDDVIWERIDRATREAVERAGESYDWHGWEEKVREKIKGAREKGFASQKKIHPRKTAAEWLINEWKGTGNVKRLEGRMLAYQDGWYKHLSGDDLRYTVATEYPEPISVSFQHADWDQITKTAYDMAPRLNFTPTRRVCMVNGTFDMDTKELRPHAPEDCLIATLPYAYDPEAKCPVYEKFIQKTFEQEDEEEVTRCIDTFEEFAAHTLFECLRFQKFIVFKGIPNTGKSTLLYIMRILHSENATSAVAVHDFGTERYKTSMVGKLVNITGEVGSTTFISDDFLKNVTAGDPVEVRFLFNESFRTILPTRIVIACNDMFRVRDTSGAVERRMIILPCDNLVREEDVDVFLWDKLKDELPGIFNRIADAWIRLRDRGKFLPPDASQKNTDAFTMENNHVLHWLITCTHQGLRIDDEEYNMPEDLQPTESPLLYKSFVEFCQERGYKQMSDITWGSKLTTISRQFCEKRNIPKLDKYNKWFKGRPIKVRNINLLNVPSF
jgi:P4 family phage/plasmid primase-like protien